MQKIILKKKKHWRGASLVVQGLRVKAAGAGGLGLIPGQGTRAHVLQMSSHTARTKGPKDPERCGQALPGTSQTNKG